MTQLFKQLLSWTAWWSDGDSMRSLFGIVLIVFSLLAFVVAAKSLEERDNLSAAALDRPSPFSRITKDRIHFYQDHIRIDLPDAVWTTFADSNSMDPLFDEGHFGIEVVPKNSSEIHIGDIVSYTEDNSSIAVVHRVFSIGDDGEWYAIIAGDNNPAPDPSKVRFDKIKRVMVGIIY